MTAPDLLPAGFRDRLPPQAEAISRLVRRVLDTVALYGYERVAPPLAEFESSIAARLKSGAARNLMRITDPVSQRSLALRPDITAQIGRIASTRMVANPRPVRLSYAGPVLKLKATQLRPEREMMQVGAEMIGLDSVAAAREIVSAAIEALEAAGVGGITIDLTLPDFIDAVAKEKLPVDADKIDDLRAALDAKDAGAVEALGASAYLPLIEATGPFEEAVAKLADFPMLDGRLKALQQIVAPLAGRVRITLDPTERHGFEYQTWLGFSLFADGASGEIGRGGSYYIQHPDGREEPAIGFSLYADPLVDSGLAVEERRRLFLPIDHDPIIATKLRAEGWVTVAALKSGDSAEAQICSHILEGEEIRPI